MKSNQQIDREVREARSLHGLNPNTLTSEVVALRDIVQNINETVHAIGSHVVPSHSAEGSDGEASLPTPHDIRSILKEVQNVAIYCQNELSRICEEIGISNQVGSQVRK